MTDDRTAQELRTLLLAVEAAGWDYARVEIDDLTVVLSSDPHPDDGAAQPEAAAATPRTAASAGTAIPEEQLVPEFAPTQAVAEQVEGAPTGAVATVSSPSIGLFWSSPKPGAPPFVAVGQQVGEDDTVCIVEVMKLMTHVTAGHAGTVVKIHVSNGEMVQYGTALVDIAVS